jgi:putative membrane protein insertion efficiency factor
MEKNTRILQQPIILLIKVYRLLFSTYLGGHCRFYPSCSHYAEEALREHGIFFGMYLTIKRLLRCHPWCSGGIDPVPTKKISEKT